MVVVWCGGDVLDELEGSVVELAYSLDCGLASIDFYNLLLHPHEYHLPWCTVSSDMVVRDSVGAVLAATAFPLSNVDSSTLTEALACVRSLELAVGLGFHTVQVECD
ncbi:hypothetical protein V6N11_050883 [Hibiscus sabdariffa]|uniref:RNase H type-1 domain-containing protein n=1 Tax=Hibiscus sabdariffa TaxID=183260 RepID=A0ABR2TBX9_9ROSI